MIRLWPLLDAPTAYQREAEKLDACDFIIAIPADLVIGWKDSEVMLPDAYWPTVEIFRKTGTITWKKRAGGDAIGFGVLF